MVCVIVIVFCDEFDESLQIEGLSDCSSFGVDVDDGLGVGDKLANGVGECAEVELVEVGDGDEGSGLREGQQFKAGNQLFFIFIAFFLEYFVVGRLHPRFLVGRQRSDRRGFA